MKNCIGTSTDGVANMQGTYKGFSAWLSKVHVWCYAHVLNLVMAETTSVVTAAPSLFTLPNNFAVFFRDPISK